MHIRPIHRRLFRSPVIALLVASAVIAGCADVRQGGSSAGSSPTASALNCQPMASSPGVAPTPTGKIVFAAGDDFDIWVINADGSGLRQLTKNPGPEFDPAWSPDGTQIVYRDSRRGINQNDEIYVMRADGSGQINLTHNPADDWGPAWSPDGQWIAFSSTRDGGIPNIYLMHPDGSAVTRLTSDEGEYPTWSPDSRRIAYASAQQNQYDLFVMDRDGSHRTQLTKGFVRDMFPAWSPYGDAIAYQTGRDFPPPTEEETQSEIHVMRPDGTCDVRVTRNSIYDAAPAWSPDERTLVVEEMGELALMARDGSGQRHLTSGHFPDWHA